MYLLDTDIVAELRRPRPDPAVARWLEGVPESQLHLSTVTIGEIQGGIEQLRERDAGQAEALSRWLDLLAASSSILPMDYEAFRLWARLVHGKPGRGSEQAMIAATAMWHDLTVVTRDTEAFALYGVPVLNPLDPPMEPEPDERPPGIADQAK